MSASELMRRALGLAEEGRGHVSPNPLVGAVLVRDGEVVGEGYHAALGEPHAEIAALEGAGEAARGATMHVTLEPCDHHGRTGPCTDAIIEAGVARVVYAARDPHPEAAGGAETLRAAGVEVERAGSALIEAAVRQNAAFLWCIVAGRPFVVLKLAMTIDGKLAGASGRRTEITGPEAWEQVHHLRADADAVLVGRGTVTADDPRLTARAETEPREQPVRVVLDSLASLASDSALVSGVGDAPVLVVAAGDAHPDRLRILRDAGVDTEIAPRTPDGLLDPYVVLRRLHDRGIRSVLVEGGARTADSFLAGDLVERFHHFVGPWFIGPRGVPAFVDAGASERDAWHLIEVDRAGDDAHMVWERRSAFERILRASGPDAS